MIDRKYFYDTIRWMFKPLKSSQVAGMNLILEEWESSGYKDLRWLAYMLATVYHETDRTMQAIEEYGKGHGHKYGISDPETGKVYYGRGLVQLTWKRNYERMGMLLSIDLVNYPELACDPLNAVRILFEGMTKAGSDFGDFTGKCLEMYFSEFTEDWVGARRIINGLDKSTEIAEHGRNFFKGLQIKMD